jgi:hypothetical protein
VIGDRLGAPADETPDDDGGALVVGGDEITKPDAPTGDGDGPARTLAPMGLALLLVGLGLEWTARRRRAEVR